MISSSGKFLGAFVQLTDGLAGNEVQYYPHGMVIPGPQDQAFLRGLLAGSGKSTTGGTFAALFFNANEYSPGQTISNATLAHGSLQTGMILGTIVGMTQSNADYFSPVYSAFTDFGTPAAGGIPATPGQRRAGFQRRAADGMFVPATTTSLTIDQTGAVSTDCAGSRTSLSTITAISLRTFRSPRPPPPARRPPSPPLQPSRSPFHPCPPATCS